MATRIRLTRGGTKKRPFYRIVIADQRAPRDGDFLERVGTYNPLLGKQNPERVVLNKERIEHWLKNGAVPSERVERFLVAAGLASFSKKTVALLEKKKAKQLADRAAKAAAEEAAKQAEGAAA